MRLNARPKMSSPRPQTHEGGLAASLTPFQELERALMATMLWEDGFYESGETIATRLGRLAVQCSAIDAHRVMVLAEKTRNEWHLRHSPLQVICGMVAAGNPHVKDAIIRCVRRADEPGELLQMLRENGLTGCIPRQVRLGLQFVLGRFSEYDLAKYDRRSAKFKLRDVLRLIRPNPQDHEAEAEQRSALWRRALDGTLETPDTWEVAISAAKSPAEKRASWERLIREGALGGMALLRNLRNLHKCGVSDGLVFHAIGSMRTDRILPYRFTAAYRAAPQHKAALDFKLVASCKELPPLRGSTAILVDVSSSMTQKLSERSDLDLIDAASTMAAIFRETCESAEVFTFDTSTRWIGDHRGLSLVDAIRKAVGGGTSIQQAIRAATRAGTFDRIIILTDEQATERISAPPGIGYLVNFAPNERGIDARSDRWFRINGFSEAVPRYIALSEAYARGAE